MQPVCQSVIFDIGNVFVTWDPRFLYEKLISDRDELDYFLSEVVTLEWHSEHDRGRSFAEGVAILSAKFPEYADWIQAFDDRWEETIGGLIPGVVSILEKLVENGVKVVALTNFSAEKWPLFCRTYDFTDHFEGVVVSGQEGLIKPDPRIFDLTIDRYNLVAEETYFIDDRIDNVRAAEACGMVGHQFTDAATLKADMLAKGFVL